MLNMFEEEYEAMEKSAHGSSIYLLFGLVLWNIASGGFLAGPLSGHFITYSRPGSIFIYLLLLSAMSVGGALGNEPFGSHRYDGAAKIERL